MANLHEKKAFCLLLLFLFVGTSLLMAGPVTTVPYVATFEDADTASWEFANVPPNLFQPEKTIKTHWEIGTQTSRNSACALYVVDNDSLLGYERGSYTIAAYRTFMLPPGQYDLTFDWKAQGSTSDGLYVAWVPASQIITGLQSGVSLPLYMQTNLVSNLRTPYPDNTVITQPMRLNPVYQHVSGTVTVDATTPAYNLVFMWMVNSSAAINPGACIDNVQLQARAATGDCGLMPTTLSKTSNSADTTTTVSWTGYPDATYDLIYWLDDEGSQDTIFGLTTNSYTFEDLDEMYFGYYKIQVRTVCPDDTYSLWSELVDVFIMGDLGGLAGEACPEVTFSFEDYIEVGEKAYKRVIPECGATSYTLKPRIVGAGGTISKYRVDPIPYNPPFPFDEGTPIFVDEDDVWGEVIDLPFKFCFFDDVYDKAVVGANGIISFNTAVAGQASGYTLTDQPDIPSPDFKNGSGGYFWRNAIYGVCEDIDPHKIIQYNTGGGIYQGILGEYPCRTLTVSWNNVPNFGTDCAANGVWNTYQTVLYEGTGVIDVYVKQRLACPTWNDGLGIIGLQNEAGTEGIVAPGRNTNSPIWEAQNEAWRFTPERDTIYDVTWYRGAGIFGEVLQTGVDSLTVSQFNGNDMDTVTVRLQFISCSNEYFDLCDTVIIDWQIKDTLVKEVTMCEGEVYSDEYIKDVMEPGQYDSTLVSIFGCDSLLYRVNVDFLEVKTRVLDTTICYGDTLLYNGKKYFGEAGVHVFDTVYQYSACENCVTVCDSLLDTVHLTVLPRIEYGVTVTDALTGPTSGSIEITMDTSYYYTLNGEQNAPTDALRPGMYELIVFNSFGCASEPEMLAIETECLEANIDYPLAIICADDESFAVPIEIQQGFFSTYSVSFSDLGRQYGFEDINEATYTFSETGNEEIIIPIPQNLRPNHYNATLILHDINCGDVELPFDYSVLYSDSILHQKWNDAIAIYSKDYNGGYEFSSFHWYHNGEPMNEYKPYLYLGMGNLFVTGDFYQVALVRAGETEEILTCPIYPVLKTEESEGVELRNEAGRWRISAPAVDDGTAFVWNAMGLPMGEWQMTDGVASIPLPEYKGVYIIEVRNQNDELIGVLRAISE